MLLAGHDTSSTTLTRCLSNLHDAPWVMDRLRAEQQAVQAQHGQQITAGALNDMPFADAVIRCVVCCWLCTADGCATGSKPRQTCMHAGRQARLCLLLLVIVAQLRPTVRCPVLKQPCPSPQPLTAANGNAGS